MPSYTSSFGTPQFWEKIPLVLILLPLFGKRDSAQVFPLLFVELILVRVLPILVVYNRTCVMLGSSLWIYFRFLLN